MKTKNLRHLPTLYGSFWFVIFKFNKNRFAFFKYKVFNERAIGSPVRPFESISVISCSAKVQPHSEETNGIIEGTHVKGRYGNGKMGEKKVGRRRACRVPG